MAKPFRIGALLLALAAGGAKAKDLVSWMTADLPPAAVQEGDFAGQGFSDLQMRLLFKQLPDFDHQIIKGSIPRNWAEMQHRDAVCFNWVTRTPARLDFAAFSEHPVTNPGYRVMIKTDRLADFMPYVTSEGDVDLDVLARQDRLSGGYIGSRDYLPAIQQFITSDKRHAHLEAVKTTTQLASLLHAGRVDFVISVPMETLFYNQTLRLGDDFTAIAVKGGLRYNKAYIACSKGPIGKAVIEKIDALLKTPEGWAGYIAPLQRWLAPEEFATAQTGKPAANTLRP